MSQEDVNEQLERAAVHGTVIPAGGTTGQVLAKESNDDGDVNWTDPGDAGGGIPAGGTTGQVLAKESNDDGDANWTDPGGAGKYMLERNCGQAPFSFGSGNIGQFVSFAIGSNPGSPQTDEYTCQTLCPVAGTLFNFFVMTFPPAPAPADDPAVPVTLTIRVNGVDTALSVTFDSDYTPGDIHSNTADEVAIEAGDLVSMKVSAASSNTVYINKFSVGVK